MPRLSRCLVASLALLPALSGIVLADHPVARDSGFRLALRRRQDNSTSTVATASLDSATASTSATATVTDSSGQSATYASSATASATSAAADSGSSYPPASATDSAAFVGPTGSASTYVQTSGSESNCVSGGGGSSVGGAISSSSDLTVLQLAYVLEVRSACLARARFSAYDTRMTRSRSSRPSTRGPCRRSRRATLSALVSRRSWSSSCESSSSLSPPLRKLTSLCTRSIEQIGSFLRDEQAHRESSSLARLTRLACEL